MVKVNKQFQNYTKEKNEEILNLLQQLQNEKKISVTKNKKGEIVTPWEIHNCFQYLNINLKENNLILKVDSPQETIKEKKIKREGHLKNLLLNLNKILKSYPEPLKKSLKELSFHYYINFKDNEKAEKPINNIISEKILNIIQNFCNTYRSTVKSNFTVLEITKLLKEKFFLNQTMPIYSFFDDSSKNNKYILKLEKETYQHKLTYNITEILEENANLESVIFAFFEQPIPISQTKIVIKKFIYKDFLFVLFRQKYLNSSRKDKQCVYFNFINTSEKNTEKTINDLYAKDVVNSYIKNGFLQLYKIIQINPNLNELFYNIQENMNKKEIENFKKCLESQTKIIESMLFNLKKI